MHLISECELTNKEHARTDPANCGAYSARPNLKHIFAKGQLYL